MAKETIEIEERKRISFHIAVVRGLPQSGWQPIASTFVHLESLETRQSFHTEYKKSSPIIEWGENIPILDLKDSSKVHFEVRSHMLWSKNVLGKTDAFTVRELLQMQREAGEERGAYIDLAVKPTAPLFGPLKLPKSPGHKRALSSPVNFMPASATRLKASLSPTRTASFPSFSTITLSLSIRETAAKDRNHTLTAADFQRFVEKCQFEALVELREIIEKLVELRDAFEMDGAESSFISLIDIVYSVAEGVRKAIGNPAAKNINKNTVACLKALNGALGPYQDLSARQLQKLGEGITTLMREMLCGAVRALESVETFLSMDNVYARDKFEFKVTAWLRYFEECERYLLGNDRNKPDALINRKSRRVRCPSRMVANPELPKQNMLEMTLPTIYNTDSYNRSNIQLVSEWIFSPSFRQPSLSIEEEFWTPWTHNIMCLSGPPGSGKTQLSAHLSKWLSELGCLGGYFTFDHFLGLSPSITLDALPQTLIHQAATVEPELGRDIITAFNNNTSATTQALEKRFETLFVTPMQAFVAGRLPGGGAWNPLAPLVFIIDGIGSSESAGMISKFVDWMAGKGIRALPPHVKFLLLGRPGLEAALKQRDANCVYAQMELEVHCVKRATSPGGRRQHNEAVMDPPVGCPSVPTFKVLIQSF